MTMTKTENTTELVISIQGRLDTTTAPALEEEVCAVADDVKALVMDFAGVEYISSSGLRVLLSAHKKMADHGSLTIRNVHEDIFDIFQVTGFSDILTIE